MNSRKKNPHKRKLELKPKADDDVYAPYATKVIGDIIDLPEQFEFEPEDS